MVEYFHMITIIILTKCLILISSCNKPHYFMGTIEYKYNYESSILNRDSLTKTNLSKANFVMTI